MAGYMTEQKALRSRLQQSLANQQAAFLGQTRGKRRLADVVRAGQEGFERQASQYGQRGLMTANVQSGIARGGLERYAENLQRDLGAETQSMQDELNAIAMREAGEQADLEDFLAAIRLQKQSDILNSAMTIKSLGSY